MAQHTPGPWSVEADDRPYERFSGEAGNPGTYVAGYNIVSASAEIVGCEGILADGYANALLIAAAPEMLSALRTLLSHYELFVGPDDDIANAVIKLSNNALAKADGRS